MDCFGLVQFSYSNVPVLKQHEGYFGTYLVKLDPGHMTRTTPQLAPEVIFMSVSCVYASI
ncbi:hypothetical protein AVEN_165922-1, partial [Araneus ventricosus]